MYGHNDALPVHVFAASTRDTTPTWTTENMDDKKQNKQKKDENGLAL